MFRELAHVDREARQIPFDAHQKQIALVVQMLVGVQGVAVRAKNKIVNRGVQPLLVGQLTRRIAVFFTGHSGGMHGSLLMVTRNRFLPILSRSGFPFSVRCRSK